MKVKKETIEEFLARGGTITKVPYFKPELKEQTTKQAPGGPANILTLAEADLFYGEARVRKTKPKEKVDLSALPEALRNKFITKLTEEVSLEEDNEEE